MKEPRIWNRLGSNIQVQNSVLGIDGAWTGTPTYNAGKFGNGSYSNSNSNYITLPDTSFSPNQFTFDFWFKTDYNVTNGVPSDASRHALVTYYLSNSARVAIEFSSATGFYVSYIGTSPINYITTTGLTFSSGVIQHFGIVYDSNQIAGSADYFRLYWNGSLLNNSTSSGGTMASGGNIHALIMFFSGAPFTNPMDGLIDNLKIYDYVKTDFTDRFNERGGMNDQEIIL